MQFNLDYFYGNEAGRFRFYRIPKALFDGDLSLEAATLYGLMLDRVGLSVKNGWLDSLGRVFIYFVQKDVQKFLRCGHNRATAFMRELERFGLIERKRQGLGKPAKIYVKNFSVCENNDPENTVNDTEKKETEMSETNRILPQLPRACGGRSRYRRNWMDEMRWIREEIRESIDYEGLVWDHPCDAELFDGYVELMTEAACSSRETVRICGQDIPVAAARSRFLKLGREHILYVRDCLCNATSAIGNIKAYTLAALYNAPATMGQYYTALVSRDMAGKPPYHADASFK